MHNKSLQDIISPSNQRQVSSAALPVSNSCQRLSQKRINTVIDTSVPEGEAPKQPKTTVSRFGNPAANTSTQERSNSLEQRLAVGEIRQNLKKVRPRVDCWNRSTTRGEASKAYLGRNSVARIEPVHRTEMTPNARVAAQASAKRDRSAKLHNADL